VKPLFALPGAAYVPTPRPTPFSGGVPAGFGMVPVVVSIATGAILGAKLFRNGSWNRSSGGWGG
jgi:hypothetical protein